MYLMFLENQFHLFQNYQENHYQRFLMNLVNQHLMFQLYL
jgi:hypothetical protein